AGDLAVGGKTAPVEIAWEFGGIAKDPWGNTKSGFDGAATLSRKDFGLTWNAALEAGGLLVGDDIAVELDLQFVKKV
ncbi:MAG: YceI family protein, partial [Bdellovibrionota bacterium]